MNKSSTTSYVSRCLFCGRALALMVLMAGALQPQLQAQQKATTQVINLYAGWNLISIQIGSTLPVASFKANLNYPERLIEIWGYQPSGDPTVPGSWKTYQPQVVSYPNDLATVDAGRGYWVHVTQASVLTLTGIPWDGSVGLSSGWNLVGFPGLSLSSNQTLDLSSVFGSNYSSIQQVWTFDASAQKFTGYDITAIPVVKDLASVIPAQGYWVYATQATSIQSAPYTALPADGDVSPLAADEAFSTQDARWHGSNPLKYANTIVHYADANDASYDLNGNGILDTPFTQDTILFEVGVSQKVITIGNTGSGTFTWSLDNGINWLSSDRSTGTVSSERDAVTLTADRTGMSPGRQSSQFTIFLGGQSKTITVLIDVPTSAGDWKGLATTQRVNGKSIPIGAVDMGLNFFMASSSTNEISFTGVLNSDTSLLFPRDVFMNGVFYSGNNFSLTTNFQMDAGDRNTPPYDTFPKTNPGGNSLTGGILNSASARGDVDTNGNKAVDVQNPFPYAIHRQVTLLGQRTTPDHMEGSYIESLTGMLPQNQPIFIEGTFFLDRQSLTPTKKSIFNGTTTNSPITIGSTSGVLYRETTLNVGSAVTVSGLTVTLNASFPDPSQLLVYLKSPTGQIVNLSQYASTLGTTYTLSNFNGLSGLGQWKLHVEWKSTALRGTFTSWGLNVQGLATYSTTSNVVDNINQPLSGVHAVLSGSNVLQQADTAPFIFNTSTTVGSTTATLASGNTSRLFVGMVINGSSALAAGTTVASIVNSSTFTLSSSAAATGSSFTTFGVAGQFNFLGLTENQYTITLTKPGYVSRSFSFYLNNANYYIGDGSGQGAATTTLSTLTSDPVVLAAETATLAKLSPSPYIGAEPMNVNLSLIVPKTQLTSLGSNLTATWDFGDGTPSVSDAADPNDDITLSTSKHIYLTAGDYTPTVTLTGSSSSITVPVTSDIGTIHVQRVTPDVRAGAPIAQIIGVGFIGSFAAPLNNSNVIEADPSNSKVVYQESKRDSASFDIDRSDATPLPSPGTAATSTFNYTKEDSDYGDPNALTLVSGNGTTFPFLARIYSANTVTADERLLFQSDLSQGTYAAYPPANPPTNFAPERFRVVCTMGGFVFGEIPSLVGDYQLQAGRIEP